LAGFESCSPASVAYEKRLAGFNLDERNEKKAQVVVDALGVSLEKAAGRTANGSLVQDPDLGLNAADDKKKGFEHRMCIISEKQAVSSTPHSQFGLARGVRNRLTLRNALTLQRKRYLLGDRWAVSPIGCQAGPKAGFSLTA
jgi:hypothetical protein